MNPTCLLFRRRLFTATAALVLCGVVATASAQTATIETVDVSGAETFGRADAPASLVIFADIAGSDVQGLGVILHGLAERYPATLKVHFRHAPAIDQTDHLLAHMAALAAGEQGKFWEMLDLLLANQSRHGHDHFLAMAAQLNLDAALFADALDSVASAQRIEADRQQASDLRVAANPTFFVNGVRLAGRKTLAELAARIDAAVASRR